MSQDELRGVNNWVGLIPDAEPNGRIDAALANHLMRYGELWQVTTNNSLLSDKDFSTDFPPETEVDVAQLLAQIASPYPYLQARWEPKVALKKCLATCVSDANEYEAVDSIYACAGNNNLQGPMPRHEGFSEEQWTAVLAKADQADRVQDKYAAPEQAADDSSQRPFWQGMVLVKKDKDSGRDEELVFVFRGTYRTDEWVSNIRGAYQVPYLTSAGSDLGDIKVHWGVRNVYSNSLKEPWSGADKAKLMMTPRKLVEKVLQDRYLKHNNPVNHPLPKITTTGHSLGAALATLCAFHIAHELPSGSTTMHEGYRKQLQTPGAVVAYAFASPRVGNKAFADAVKATPGMRVLRLSNLCDLVPRTPLPLGGRQGWLARLLEQLLGLPQLPVGPASESDPDLSTASSLPEGLLEQLQAERAGNVLQPNSLLPNFRELSKWCAFFSGLGGVVDGEDGVQEAQSEQDSYFRDYLHVGRNIEFRSASGPFKPRQLSEVGPDVGAAAFASHNPEVYLVLLGLLSTQPIKRDFALLNRGDDLLAEALATKYNIPANWWADSSLQGLVVQGSGKAKVYRRPGWTGDEPDDADPVTNA